MEMPLHLRQMTFALLAWIIPVSGQQYTISTVVGGLPPATPSIASMAAVGASQGLAVDPLGSVYFGSLFHCVFKVDSHDNLSRQAGTCRPGYSGDNGDSASAQLNLPSGVALYDGRLYIADRKNNRIRMVSQTGKITTIAGIGTPGYSGDNGQATGAQLNGPAGIALDSFGNLYIADTDNHVIREVFPDGTIITLAGTGIQGYSGDGGQPTSAQLNSPVSVAIDASGALYIADTGNQRIREVAGGAIFTLAGNGTVGYAGDGGFAAGAELWLPRGVAVDASGNVYIADTSNNRVRRVSGGVITSVAGNGTAGYSGDGGAATSAQLNGPTSVAIDSSGNLYIVDGDNDVVRIVSAGTISTFAGVRRSNRPRVGELADNAFLGLPSSTALDSSGNLYIADTVHNRILKVADGNVATVAGTGFAGYSGDGLAATDGELNGPTGVAVDSSDNLYIADRRNNRVRMVSGGIISTLAGDGTRGFSGDNGPASKAALWNPYAVAVHGDALYISDSGNSRVRQVSGGMISTFAGAGKSGDSGDGGKATDAELGSPTGLAVDLSGNVYIADTAAHRIRMVGNGIISTLAGTGVRGYSGDGDQARDAQLDSPTGVAVDSDGTVYIADTNNSRIRQLATTGIITTIAGNGTVGYVGDGGDAIAAELYSPTGLSVASGRIYLADKGNNSVRILAASGAATMTSPTPGSTLTSSSVTFQWSAGSATQYGLWIGSTGVGSSNLATPPSGTNTSYTATALPADGRTLYVRLWSLVSAVWQYNDYTYTAVTASAAVMTSPTPGSTLTSSSVTFQWSAGGATQYGLWIGSTGVGSANLAAPPAGTNTSYTATGLPTDGRTLYVRLWSLLSGTWQYRDYTYTALTLAPAVMISPANGSTLTSSSVTFQWSAGSATQYGLWIGSTGVGSSNLATPPAGTNTSYTATGLPTDGRTLYVRLWSLINGVWQFNDYTYVAYTFVQATLSVSNVSVGNNLQVPITITFNPAPTSNLSLTITSLTPGLVLLGSAGDAGAVQLVAPVTAGTPSVATYVKAFAASGTVTITASAAGYANGSGTVTLAKSGFVVGKNGIGDAFTTYQGAVTALTVYAARLDSSNVFVEPEQVSGGISVTVPIASSPTSVGTLSFSSLLFTGGTSSGTVNFTASSTNTGIASVVLTQPSGFTTPAVGGTLNVTVQTSGLIPPSGITVGNNLQTTASVSLNGPAPAVVTVTLHSSDSTKLKFANTASGTGSDTITVIIAQNQTSSTDFYVRGYGSSGSVPYTISASSYGTVNTQMPLGPSGLAIQTPGGLGTNFTMSLGGGFDATLTVWTALLDSNSGAVIATQAVAADQSISATVTSSNTATGTITASPIVITGGSPNGTTTFHPLGIGTSTITASATGYGTGTVQATVQGCTLGISNGLTIGQFLEAQGVVLLTCPAGTGGAQVLLTSNSSSLKLALNPTDPGSNTITVNVGAGSSLGYFWAYASGASGTATYTASASGYGTATDTVTLAPSGMVILQSNGCYGACTVNLSGGAVSLMVESYQLSTDGANTPQTLEPVAGNGSVNVLLSNSNPAAGTLSSPSVNIVGGSAQSSVMFTPLATQSTTVSVTQPTGWTVPGLYGTTNVSQIKITVQ